MNAKCHSSQMTVIIFTVCLESESLTKNLSCRLNNARVHRPHEPLWMSLERLATTFLDTGYQLAGQLATSTNVSLLPATRQYILMILISINTPIFCSLRTTGMCFCRRVS